MFIVKRFAIDIFDMLYVSPNTGFPRKSTLGVSFKIDLGRGYLSRGPLISKLIGKTLIKR